MKSPLLAIAILCWASSASGELVQVVLHSHQLFRPLNTAPNETATATLSVPGMTVTVATVTPADAVVPKTLFFFSGPNPAFDWNALSGRIAELAGTSFPITGTIDAGSMSATNAVYFPTLDYPPQFLRLIDVQFYASEFFYKPKVGNGPPGTSDDAYGMIAGSWSLDFEVPEPGTMTLCVVGLCFVPIRRRSGR